MDSLIHKRKNFKHLFAKNRGFLLVFLLYELILIAGFKVNPNKWYCIIVFPLLYFFIKSVFNDSYKSLTYFLNKKVLLILMTIQGLGLILLIIVKYFSLSYNIFDTGIFAHVIFNISLGKGFYNNILQAPAWVDHFTPNLTFLSPFFRIYPTILWLPAFRLIAYLSCIPILWKISAFYLKETQLRHLVLFLWLVNYPLLMVLNFDFQPSSLALPFLLLSFYFFLKKSYILFLLDIIFLLGFKEHMSLAWISIGVWLYFIENKKFHGILMVIGGIIAGFFIVYILIPYLSNGIPLHHLGRFGPFDNLFQKSKFVFLILLSVGLVPFLNPKTLLFIIPGFGISLISNTHEMSTLKFHYQDLPVTLTFVSVILGLSNLEKQIGWFFRLRPSIKKIGIVISLCSLIIYNSCYPGRFIRSQWPSKIDLETISEIWNLQKNLNTDTGNVFWCLNSLGVYFIDWPYLRSIKSFKDPMREKNFHYLLLADDVNHWPLSEKYKDLIDAIENKVKKSYYSEFPGFKRLRVYSSNNL